jgi:hypothetical protein
MSAIRLPAAKANKHLNTLEFSEIKFELEKKIEKRE